MHGARLLKRCVCLVFLPVLFPLPVEARAQEPAERVQFARDIVIEAGQEVGDIVCIGCSILVRGTVLEDAVTVGGNIEIDGRVQGDAVASLGGIRLGPNARVGGDAVAIGVRIERDPQASVGGEVVSELPFPSLRSLLLAAVLSFSIMNLTLVLISYLVAGEHRVGVVASTVRTRPGLALLAGLGMLTGAVILYVISPRLGPVTPVFATGVSIVLFLTLVLGYTGISFWLGHRLTKSGHPLKACLLGALLITFLQLVPLLGLFAWLAFLLLGLGSPALSGYGTAPEWLTQRFARGAKAT